MKPIIPNPKEPWKVCEKQLAELDRYIGINHSGAKLDVGVKYARWAVFDGDYQFYRAPSSFEPDYVFRGKTFGKEQTILMWLPFFS